MAQKKDLDYYLAQARRIAEHREAGAEAAIRKEFKSLLKELKTYIADVHEKYAAEDGSLFFADLQKAGYDARFLEEIEKRIDVATPKVAKELHSLVEDTYDLAYKSMIEGVEKAADGAALGKTFSEAVSITPAQIKKVVQNPIMDVALQKNHRDIVYDIKRAVAVGLMNGDRYTTIAQKITTALDKENGPYKNAILIARTEAHRVREAGDNDAAVAVDKELQKGTTGMRMCKVWKTMKDERVRPQYVRKTKKGWKRGISKTGADHVKLEGQTVLADEMFDLKDGNLAPCPGSTGIAGHDCNCRCYTSKKMLTDAEYFDLTGKHFPGYKAEDEQETLVEEKKQARQEMREKIKEDRKRVRDMKSDLRDVDVDIAEHDRRDFDGLKGLKKSTISGRIQAIEDREKVINPLVDRYYNRPARGTPEYEEWREWKKTIDSSALIDEQMQLAQEKASLNSMLRKYEKYEKWEQWKVDHPLADLQTKRTSLVREIKRLEAEIKDIEEQLAADPVMRLVDMLDDNGVTFKTVKKHAKALTESEIISALAGGDTTKGSCASVGLAYMGQRGGLDVLDFRGGDSCDFFATTANLRAISHLPGVKTIRQVARSSTTAGNKLLKQVETGKEYYLVSGRHAAIVRKLDDDTLQYLELQSATHSGWHNFDGNPRYTLKYRFGEVSGFDVESFMIEVDSFKDSDELKQLLGYINTADGDQRKGKHGTTK